MMSDDPPAGPAPLLDANILLAAVLSDHPAGEAAISWLAGPGAAGFAVCPITQGAVVRGLLRTGVTARGARAALASVADLPGYEFWPDALSYLDVPLDKVIGHRQVTDAYLVELARSRGRHILTFDRGLIQAHPDAARAPVTPG
ncbi:MAG: PIN domain-containing protein [Bifidobacteriaceae bacterium]|jgi:toxin-antitoxin system PIN domain toxin|nr:PIN domain-containing protein [Bifidobacteriaceae bacterium]